MHMERSAVNKNRCITLKDWDRLRVHAKYYQIGGQKSLGVEWVHIPVYIEKLSTCHSTYYQKFLLVLVNCSVVVLTDHATSASEGGL